MIPKDLRAFARERLTVSSASLPLTASVYHTDVGKITEKKAQAASIKVVTNNIYRTENGATPSASVGVTNYPDDIIELNGHQAITGTRMLRTGADATVEVTYYA